MGKNFNSLILIVFLFQGIASDYVKAADQGAKQIPDRCQNQPLFKVENKWSLTGRISEVRFCHGMVLKSKYNEDEIKGQGTNFKVTYVDGSSEEIDGILVADEKFNQIHIYHTPSSKLPAGAIQPNGYNPSWFDQFLNAQDGRGYFRSIHPAWDEPLFRNIYEFSASGFKPTEGPYQVINNLPSGKFEVVVTIEPASEGATEYLNPKMSGTYWFTPFLSLQELYTGQRSLELKKNWYLSSFHYYDVKGKPLSENEKASLGKMSKDLLRVECERRRDGSFKTDKNQTQIFQNAYEREFESMCK